MNFAFTDEQNSLRELAREILDKEATTARVKEVETSDEWFDRALWKQLADANLLGIAIPEEQGGMGMGFLELCVLLEEAGRSVAPAPFLPTLVYGALPIAEFGSDALKQRFLGRVATGECILTAALTDSDSDDPLRPGTRAVRDGEDWRLNGSKRFVPAAEFAERILVPADTDTGVALFLVDPSVDGVRLEHQRTSTGERISNLELSRVRVSGADQLQGEGIAAWLHERALIALCAVQVGVSERAIEITGAYVTEREQFGTPIGTFQAVQHRSADAYIDLESIRWTTWRGAWKLANGHPAPREAAVAKFWAAEGGARIANAVQHLHGGIGVDLDYPIHRYFLWTKALELSLGGAARQLAWLGKDMARSGPQELV